MYSIRDMIAQRFNSNAFERVVYTESHDEVAESAGKARVPELISPGNADSFFAQKRSTLGASLAFTAPGIPMIFMGQEILEWGSWSDARQLDWSKAGSFSGIRNLYRELIRLRRNWYDNTRGLKGQEIHVHHVNDQDKVVGFHRWNCGGPRDDVVIILNFANRSYDSYRVGLPREGLWRVRFNGDWGGYSSAFMDHPSFDVMAARGGTADNMPCSGDVSVGPYAAIILSQDG